MNDKLKVAIIQQNIVNGNKEENLLIASDAISRLESDTDIVVLPELFSTGFLSDTDRMKSLAELNTGQTMKTLSTLAKKYNIAICGSFIAKTGKNYFNRAFLIEPSGDETFYDKRHLFSLSEEYNVFTAGYCRCPIVRYRGWNLNIVICYDVRFPIWCRNRENEYDVLLIVANWPRSRATAWKQLLIGRAIENQSYVIGANRIGSDEYGDYPGDSFIVDHKGHVVGRYTDEGFIYAELDKQSLKSFRMKFPVWKDADVFNLL